MIKFALRCEQEHAFESWFKSSAAFDRLDRSNLLTCPICGSSAISKEVMSPQIQTTQSRRKTPDRQSADLSQPNSQIEKAFSELKSAIERSSEYVGRKFVEEARAIHNGEAPKRSIIGEARIDEARSLLREGVPVAPLPWTPSRKLQ